MNPTANMLWARAKAEEEWDSLTPGMRQAFAKLYLSTPDQQVSIHTCKDYREPVHVRACLEESDSDSSEEEIEPEEPAFLDDENSEQPAQI